MASRRMPQCLTAALVLAVLLSTGAAAGLNASVVKTQDWAEGTLVFSTSTNGDNWSDGLCPTTSPSLSAGAIADLAVVDFLGSLCGQCFELRSPENSNSPGVDAPVYYSGIGRVTSTYSCFHRSSDQAVASGCDSTLGIFQIRTPSSMALPSSPSTPIMFRKVDCRAAQAPQPAVPRSKLRRMLQGKGAYAHAGDALGLRRGTGRLLLQNDNPDFSSQRNPDLKKTTSTPTATPTTTTTPSTPAASTPSTPSSSSSSPVDIYSGGWLSSWSDASYGNKRFADYAPAGKDDGEALCNVLPLRGATAAWGYAGAFAGRKSLEFYVWRSTNAVVPAVDVQLGTSSSTCRAVNLNSFTRNEQGCGSGSGCWVKYSSGTQLFDACSGVADLKDVVKVALVNNNPSYNALICVDNVRLV